MSRRVIGFGSVALALLLALGGTLLFHAQAAAPTYTTLPHSFAGLPKTTQPIRVHPSTAPMTVAVVLRPSNQAQLTSLLADLYARGNSSYHQWLGKGQFESRFAPNASQVAATEAYLRSSGLSINQVSPFLLEASGTTASVQKAFRVSIVDYATAGGTTLFSNNNYAQVPTSLAPTIVGIMGLTNTGRAHAKYITTASAAKASGRPIPHYGAGPSGSGLTPSQTTSLYNAGGIYHIGVHGQGSGRTLAVFELSGYTPSDITAYEHKYFGTGENVPLVNINVDGGPVTPVCPAGDTCNPPNDYSGDIEVEADIQQQIALAPKINSIEVYNAPNDYLGITIVDEYNKIAHDDTADSISSSWGLCEQDAGFAQSVAESIAFYQMAAQGQSMFSAAGDTGAFDCLRDTGSPNQTAVAVDDPSSDPYVTAVGGTSFGTYDPGTTANPTYPTGFETVWNPLNLCRTSGNGLNDCINFGAGGGGNSDVWGAPTYQHGPNVFTSYTKHQPYCVFNQHGDTLAPGAACRELPDVSANADEFTPYAEYCTGSPSTNSTCATFSSTQPSPGWFGIGGTSLSSPVWSGIIALWDGYHNGRYGNASEDLYDDLYNTSSPYTLYFHDITGYHQTENNNGLFPVTPLFDEATGIGTPNITGIGESHP